MFFDGSEPRILFTDLIHQKHKKNTKLKVHRYWLVKQYKTDHVAINNLGFFKIRNI